MDALVFDFDGVVADTEPLHLAGFRKVLATVRVDLTEADYYSKYLGYDDHDCFAAALADSGIAYTEEQIAALTATKTAIIQRMLTESLQPLPGAVELVAAAARARLPVGICSGALRREIELASAGLGIMDKLVQIVAAEDVTKGKPDGQGYALAVSRLAEATGRPLRPDRSVAIEDSPAGIEAAKSAGLKVLAVTNSYGADSLAAADRIVDSLAEVSLGDLDKLV